MSEGGGDRMGIGLGYDIVCILSIWKFSLEIKF
jgi:hypothetical protein